MRVRLIDLYTRGWLCTLGSFSSFPEVCLHADMSAHDTTHCPPGMYRVHVTYVCGTKQFLYYPDGTVAYQRKQYRSRRAAWDAWEECAHNQEAQEAAPEQGAPPAFDFEPMALVGPKHAQDQDAALQDAPEDGAALQDAEGAPHHDAPEDGAPHPAWDGRIWDLNFSDDSDSDVEITDA